MSDQRLDAELSLRGIVGIGLVLIAITAAVTALMWFMSLGLRSHTAANDPAPSALPEARTQQLPPGPQLQADPIGEIEQMRAEEAALLDHSAWIDESVGTARVSIDTAIEIVGKAGQLPGAASSAKSEEDAL